MVESATQIIYYAYLFYIFMHPQLPPPTDHVFILISSMMIRKTIPCLPTLVFLIVQPKQPNLGWGHPLVLCCRMQFLCWEPYGPKVFHDHHHHLEPEEMLHHVTMSRLYSERLRTSWWRFSLIINPSAWLSILRDFVGGCASCWTVGWWFQYSATLPGFQDQMQISSNFKVSRKSIVYNGYTINIYKHYLHTTFVNWCQLHQSSLTLLKAGIFTPTPARRKCRSCTVFRGVGWVQRSATSAEIQAVFFSDQNSSEVEWWCNRVKSECWTRRVFHLAGYLPFLWKRSRTDIILSRYQLSTTK